MKHNDYFIVSLWNINKARYYPKALESRKRAREIIDIYLGDGAWLILSGLELMAFRSTGDIKPYKHSPFSKFTPKELRKNNPGRKKKRKKISKILTHKFRAIWEQMPPEKFARQKIFNRGRTVIRTQLLK